MPLQHASRNMLKAMKRGGTCESLERLIKRVRDAVPNIAIRTTFIVGYPGETEKDFDELMKFIKNCKFDYVGVFTYSVEDGIAFAKNIGFEPHKDYKYANKLFGDVDATDCTETFTFGKDGKPYYISGPYDSQQKIDKIQQTLMKNCGEGNFDFMVVVPDDLGFKFEN